MVVAACETVVNLSETMKRVMLAFQPTELTSSQPHTHRCRSAARVCALQSPSRPRGSEHAAAKASRHCILRAAGRTCVCATSRWPAKPAQKRPTTSRHHAKGGMPLAGGSASSEAGGML